MSAADFSLDHIHQPTLLLNEGICRKNIEKMVSKARNLKVDFRPHAKTCQSAEIMEWVREYGVEKITVSSVKMAEYFAQHGWKDILIAFPVNLRQINEINRLANEVNLHVLVESVEVVRKLATGMQTKVNVWMDVDCGYGRTGIRWDDNDQLKEVWMAIQASRFLKAEGILTHAGNTYYAENKGGILQIHQETKERMCYVQEKLSGLGALKISVGDTPSCSVTDDFGWADEIRPGNFMFYDLKQASIEACEVADIAVVMACPVVSVYPDKNKAVVHGGAVHFSKDFLGSGEKKYFGIGVIPEENGWEIIPNMKLTALSQEHGTINFSKLDSERCKPGKLMFVLPIHSCLTANLMRSYVTLSGKKIEMMPI